MNSTENYHKQKESHDLIKAQQAATDYLLQTFGKLPWTQETVVAGGAPRDWYRGSPAADIDIFLIGTTITQTQLEKIARDSGIAIKLAGRSRCASNIDVCDDYGNDYGYGNPCLKWVYNGVVEWRLSHEIKGAHKFKFQVIVTTFPDVQSLLGSFPVEISKFIWNHVTKTVHGEPGALKDIKEKTVTQTSVDYKRGKYLTKILQKFPTHRYINKVPAAPIPKVKAGGTKISKASDKPVNKRMVDPTNFVYWLQGFFEMANPTMLNEHQTAMIKDHLALVFVKETPNRNNQPKKILSPDVPDQRRPPASWPTEPVQWPHPNEDARQEVEVMWKHDDSPEEI